MPIIVAGRTLRSYLTRVTIGTRSISATGTTTSTGIRGFLSRLGGFAFGLITKFFPLSISSIFGMLVQAYFAIKTFDWNQTDKQIEEKIKANNKAVRDGLAPVIGQTLGFGTVRLANFVIGRLAPRLPGSTAGTVRGINIPVLSGRIGLALAEEGNEEIRGAVLSWLTTVRTAMISNLVMSFVLTARSLKWFGMESITAPRPNGSFAEKIETEIKKLPDDWENFAEELLEEFEESIIEAGYVVAFEIDDYFISQREAARRAGAATTVTIGTTATT